jgi:uncharacterized repeat protein (TIGR03803 family)
MRNILVLVLATAVIPVTVQAAPRSFQILQSFSIGSPMEPIADTTGAVFGTTYGGGKHGGGVVFKLSGKRTESVLYDFSRKTGPSYPSARLLRDQSGDLFGIASRTDKDIFGTAVFKISHGRETTLHFFGEGQSATGAPHGGVVGDESGNLYGVTCGGGEKGAGLVFEISAAGETTVLYDFAGPDGSCPLSELLADGQGGFYGTTWGGGASDHGVVFRLPSNGNLKVIHSFTGDDGCQIEGGLTQDDTGNLYGTAAFCGAGAGGTAYRISPSGKMTVLHAFTGTAGDGSAPRGTLVRDAQGNLYGMTGGNYPYLNEGGTVFQITPHGREMVLHTFTGGENDGATPLGGLAMDDAGNLYGSTLAGGAYGNGVVFKLSKAARQFRPRLQSAQRATRGHRLSPARHRASSCAQCPAGPSRTAVPSRLRSRDSGARAS